MPLAGAPSSWTVLGRADSSSPLLPRIVGLSPLLSPLPDPALESSLGSNWRSSTPSVYDLRFRSSSFFFFARLTSGSSGQPAVLVAGLVFSGCGRSLPFGRTSGERSRYV